MSRVLYAMVKGKVLLLWSYCRYEGETCLNHLEEFRAERESNRLNMASRLELAMKETETEQNRERWWVSGEIKG